ncbi:FAD-binding domain-containing protein [Mycena vulgaris]|nr:FAD-binding domain-containing protein [Mycena vulgaris]
MARALAPFLALLSIPFVVGAAINTTTASALACGALNNGPLSAVMASSGAQFVAGATSAWNLLNAELVPSCIVFPRTTQDVATAMAAIFTHNASYAVQSGGHSAMQGWNNVQNGVLIHFMNMRNVSYDAASSSVTFQPGLTWGEALDALEPHGVAVAGGRVNDVGTGLLLGGGISYLAGSVGYSADTLREVDVVLVNGQVVTATATNKFSDLFRALKGGANRFGIVTRYVVDAIPTGTQADKSWFGGEIVYANSSADAVLEALAHYALNVNDPKAAILLYYFNSFTDGVISPTIVLNAFYNGASLPNASFGEFMAIPSVQTSLAPISYYNISYLLGDPGAPISLVEQFGASTLEGSNDITPYREIFSLYTALCEEFKAELGGTTLSFTTIMDSQIEAGRARGGNAIDPSRGGFNMIQFSMSLPEGPKTLSPALSAARQKFFAEAPRTPGLPLYIAESDKSQQVFSTYGGYEFLKTTYNKYDPTRFNVLHTDGPSGL